MIGEPCDTLFFNFSASGREWKTIFGEESLDGTICGFNNFLVPEMGVCARGALVIVVVEELTGFPCVRFHLHHTIDDLGRGGRGLSAEMPRREEAQ